MKTDTDTDTDLDLFGERRILIANPDAYAAAPGSGPQGKRCKHCTHYALVGAAGGTVHRKCALIKSTHGAATDIKASTPACSRFEAPPQTRAEYYNIDAKRVTAAARAGVKLVRARLTKVCAPYADIDASMEGALNDVLDALTKFEGAIADSAEYLATPFD